MFSRRMLFQVHLWIGVGLGLYISLISLSGSAIVFRREMDRAFCGKGPGGGAACEPAFVTWLAELHDHLLSGRTGLFFNGIGAIVILITCVTGVIIWWPGRGRWWPRMSIRAGVSWRAFLRDLHNMLGFWLLLFISMWAVTGIYFAFPDPFHALSDLARGEATETASALFIEDAIAGMTRLHFGRAFGPLVKVIWVVLGLMPCVLFVTGALMWWNRVLRKAIRGDARIVGSLTAVPAEGHGPGNDDRVQAGTSLSRRS